MKINQKLCKGVNFVGTMEIIDYSVSDVCKLTGKTAGTVRKWCQSGILKARRPEGCKSYIIRKIDFDRFWYGEYKPPKEQ